MPTLLELACQKANFPLIDELFKNNAKPSSIGLYDLISAVFKLRETTLDAISNIYLFKLYQRREGDRYRSGFSCRMGVAEKFYEKLIVNEEYVNEDRARFIEYVNDKAKMISLTYTEVYKKIREYDEISKVPGVYENYLKCIELFLSYVEDDDIFNDNIYRRLNDYHVDENLFKILLKNPHFNPYKLLPSMRCNLTKFLLRGGITLSSRFDNEYLDKTINNMFKYYDNYGDECEDKCGWECDHPNVKTTFDSLLYFFLNYRPDRFIGFIKQAMKYNYLDRIDRFVIDNINEIDENMALEILELSKTSKTFLQDSTSSIFGRLSKPEMKKFILKLNKEYSETKLLAILNVYYGTEVTSDNCLDVIAQNDDLDIFKRIILSFKFKDKEILKSTSDVASERIKEFIKQYNDHISQLFGDMSDL